MVIIKDLIADWERMLASLQQQLVMFETGKAGLAYSDRKWDTIVERIKICITELEDLLAEHRDAQRP
jgi:hypothetical protein